LEIIFEIIVKNKKCFFNSLKKRTKIKLKFLKRKEVHGLESMLKMEVSKSSKK